MIEARVERWAAWAPGLEQPAAWERWSAAPQPLSGEGHPEARFLPAMLRRRCRPLARMALTAAFGCCPEARRGEVATVFASRHGNINESIPLLEQVAGGQPLSPTLFSHTVHNAQAGLFSIAAGNRQGSSSLAAREDTFASGYLEALCFLERRPERPVLLVVADAPLADTFAPLVEEPPGAYALALLLSSAGAGPALRFGLGGGAPPAPAAWPDAAEFLRWFLRGEAQLALGGTRRWTWERAAAA